jgi:hypothetical protein
MSLIQKDYGEFSSGLTQKTLSAFLLKDKTGIEFLKISAFVTKSIFC